MTTFDTQTFGSMDFKTWYRLGVTPGFARGECPSFFPLPKTTPGAKVSASDPQPTHVHKSSQEGKDWMNVGTYTEGPAKTTGKYEATPGITAGLKYQIIDVAALYASKDFYDPVKQRRINWGWARTAGPTQVQSMPREVTWHPELQQLVFSPVEEQESLRTGKIGAFSGSLEANKSTSLGLAKEVGKQSEVMVSFSRPKVNTTLVVSVMVMGDARTDFAIHYVPGESSVKVGSGTFLDNLKLLDSDDTLEIRLFVDQTFAEVYFQGGRVAMTVSLNKPNDDAGVTVSSSESGVTVDATAWGVSSIWVTPEEVMRTPRLDGKPTDAWKELVSGSGGEKTEYV